MISSGPLVIVLRWIGALSPNRARRMAISARSGNEKADRDYARAMAAAALSEYGSRPAFLDGDDKLYVHIFLEYPTNFGWDVLNATAALKASLDGICDALAVNDVRFVVMEDFGAAVKGGRITITIGRRFGWLD